MTTATERSLIGRLAAYEMHAQHDPRETTAKARSTFMASFLDKVDPDRVLPEAERNRRAEAARKAHFTKLALKSAQSRRKNSTTANASPAAPLADGALGGAESSDAAVSDLPTAATTQRRRTAGQTTADASAHPSAESDSAPVRTRRAV